MINIRRNKERGAAQFDWLKSRHTFSFGNYYDPKHMGYSALRVINDDEVIPGAGFPTHGHRDMEIISYVLEGEIAHRDSEGNIATLPAGEFQLMSAGSGITHSELNALTFCSPATNCNTSTPSNCAPSPGFSTSPSTVNSPSITWT